MIHFIITCEHGGNIIPDEYQHLFVNAEDTLMSHRGWDPGALTLANEIHIFLKAPLFYSETSRLLIELNRSLHHPALFSSFTKTLSLKDKNDIIQQHYLPYRNGVERKIQSLIDQGFQVIHLSIHSFTPTLNGQERNCDIGLLYDPQNEKEFCIQWKKNLQVQEPDWRIRMNYPYKGTSDGFTTSLRKKFNENYQGIELEVNQELLGKDPIKVSKVIKSSLLNFKK